MHLLVGNREHSESFLDEHVHVFQAVQAFDLRFALSEIKEPNLIDLDHIVYRCIGQYQITVVSMLFKYESISS